MATLLVGFPTIVRPTGLMVAGVGGEGVAEAGRGNAPSVGAAAAGPPRPTIVRLSA